MPHTASTSRTSTLLCLSNNHGVVNPLHTIIHHVNNVPAPARACRLTPLCTSIASRHRCCCANKRRWRAINFFPVVRFSPQQLAQMAKVLSKVFSLFRRLVLPVVGFLFVLYILRTPTTPYYNPGKPRPPEPDNKFPRFRLPEALQNFLDWDPPKDDPDHYPPYDQYAFRDYDPNRWESFPQYVQSNQSSLPRFCCSDRACSGILASSSMPAPRKCHLTRR